MHTYGAGFRPTGSQALSVAQLQKFCKKSFMMGGVFVIAVASDPSRKLTDETISHSAPRRR
ncbi:MAG: hypothetical protein GVY04_05345 [Cyanobacteria bacterium]|jgi:hypothetical protein|nr:hypothetical protein [Cyanobacteria bacterium GSL.Bin1]